MQRDKPPAHDVLDDPLWTSIRGAGSPTVVFEAGGGEDSSVWSELEAEVRNRYEVRTMLYDRAGLGRSPPSPPPYRIDREADALRREFDRHGITAPVVLVAHSYGGFVATIVAATDSRVAWVVLVDANLARFFDDAQIERLFAAPGHPHYEFFGQQAHGPAPLFEVDDVHSVRRELEAAGLDVVGSTERDGRWEWIHVRAPDGNLYEFASRLHEA